MQTFNFFQYYVHKYGCKSQEEWLPRKNYILYISFEAIIGTKNAILSVLADFTAISDDQSC